MASAQLASAVPSTLRAGDVAIVSYETDVTLLAGGSPDSLRFVALKPLGSGTVIFFSDRNWTGTAFAAPSAGEGTFTFTAASDLAVGTVTTVSSGQLTAGGITLSNTGETIYAYQGTDANTPTRFLFAIDVADGNNTFPAAALNGTGLVAGTNAVAFGLQNAVFTGSQTGIAQTQILAISNNTSWYGLNLDDNPGTPNFTEVIDTVVQTPFFDPSDAVIVSGWAGGGQSLGLLRIGEENNAGTAANAARLFRDTALLRRPQEVKFDFDDGFYFILDTNGNDQNGIIRGNIADLVSGTNTPSWTRIVENPQLRGNNHRHRDR